MWVVSAGRLTESVVDILKQYYDRDILGVEMVKDILGEISEESSNSIQCITLLDSGMETLRNWTPVLEITSKYKNVPILIYSRYEKLTPKSDFFGDNVDVVRKNKYISISDLAHHMKRVEITD